MEDGIFRSGQLHLSDSPTIKDIPASSWGDILTNKILVVVSVCLMLVFLMEIIRFAPTVIYCLRRARGSINLEHSLSLARTRNVLALVHIIPFCLVIDYAGIVSKDFIPSLWSAPATIVLILAYLLARFLAFKIFIPRKSVPAETSLAAHRVIFSIFIVLTTALLATVGILILCEADMGLTRQIVLYETAFFYLLAFLRAGQILAADCNGFSTFLYLCGLEIVPTGLLVASVVYI